MLSDVARLLRATLTAGILGMALALAPAAAAAVVPKAVDFWGMAPDALGARPGALGWTTDLGASFNGTSGSNSGRGPSSNLSWNSWGAGGATGSGDLWVPRERGENISWKRYPATLRFAAPRTLSFVTTLNGGPPLVTRFHHRRAVLHRRRPGALEPLGEFHAQAPQPGLLRLRVPRLTKLTRVGH